MSLNAKGMNGAESTGRGNEATPRVNDYTQCKHPGCEGEAALLFMPCTHAAFCSYHGQVMDVCTVTTRSKTTGVYRPCNEKIQARHFLGTGWTDAVDERWPRDE